MTPQQKRWTLTVTTELDDGDRKYVAEMIRQGVTEGEIPPAILDDKYIEWPPYGPHALNGVGSTGHHTWIRRFVRRAVGGDYALIETAFWADTTSSGPAISSHIRYVLCSDPDEPDTTAGFAITVSPDSMPIAHIPDDDEARKLCTLVDPATLDWDGTPSLVDVDPDHVPLGIRVERYSRNEQ